MFWHVSGILWKIRNYGATIEEEPSLRRTLRELKKLPTKAAATSIITPLSLEKSRLSSAWRTSTRMRNVLQDFYVRNPDGRSFFLYKPCVRLDPVYTSIALERRVWVLNANLVMIKTKRFRSNFRILGLLVGNHVRPSINGASQRQQRHPHESLLGSTHHAREP